MKTIILILILSCSLCAQAESKSEKKEAAEKQEAPKIKAPSKADTIVLASSKNSKDFYIELKRRAAINDYAFESTDDDARLFVTKWKDVTKRAAVQFKVYVKDVNGGSNAIYSGNYKDLKKLKTKAWYRDQKIYYNRSGKPASHAWKAFMRFGVGSKKWKYTFIRR